MFNFKPKPSSHQRSKSTPYANAPTPATSSNSKPHKLFDDESDENLLVPPSAFITGSSGVQFHTPTAIPSPQALLRQLTFTNVTTTKPQLPPLVTSHTCEQGLAHTTGLALPASLYSIANDINFIPSPQQSPILSPTKEKWSFLPSIKGDNLGENKRENKPSVLAGWFDGESAPISIGVPLSPVKEKAEFTDMTAGTTRPSTSRKSTLTSIIRPPTASTSRFSFFSTKTVSSTPQPVLPDLDDAFANLDIKTALQPNGQDDPFSPSSFKDLLRNAESLLCRLQKSYKQRTDSLRELTAEKDAQTDELEEARTRAEHLKLQLDDMTTRMAEQDTAMMNLVDQLAEQKQVRQDEDAKRTIRLVETNSDGCNHCRQAQTQRRKKRPSTASMVSDSGFESEDESEVNSVFSHTQDNMSPTFSLTSSPSITSPKGFDDISLSRNSSKKILPPLFPLNLDGKQHVSRDAVWCANREGFKATEAWDVAEMLMMENSGLKQRVEVLESALNGCLDLVHSLGA
ncbi:hypothetical protein MMC19_006885 [Ptychographa xylographoides]|nr:hypothetical protein [Ptychographa xylographoides]